VVGCSGGGGGGDAAGDPAATPPAGAPARTGGGATSAPAPALAPTKPKTAVVVARSGEGFLEHNQGKLFAHLKGTPREMGEQYGELLGAHIESLVLEMPRFLATQRFPSWLFPSAAALSASLFRPHVPPDVVAYMEGVVAGNYGGELIMEFVGQGAVVKEGDFVITSGIGGGYPPGVLIGRVSSVQKTEQDLFQIVHVDHFASLTDLEHVLVLTSFEPRALEKP
jgi:hypothetical protein